MFRDEFDQLKTDRKALRESVFKFNPSLKSGAPMPVNLPRIITNIRAVNQIKNDSQSDLDPRYYF